MRRLTEKEKSIIQKLLSVVPNSHEYLNDKSDYLCEQIDEYSSLRIYDANCSNAEFQQHPVSWGIQKCDGYPFNEGIEFILFTKLSSLSELQIFQQGGGDLCSDIDPSKIDVFIAG